MSQFYSDLLSWTTAGAGLMAAYLAGAPQPPADGERGVPGAAPVLLAAAGDDVDAMVREAIADTPGGPLFLPLDQVRPATLSAVTFTSTGDSSDLKPAAVANAATATGRVTGRSVNLRAGPGTGYAVVGRATRDEELDVTGETDGAWVEVQGPSIDGSAWIHGKFFVVR